MLKKLLPIKKGEGRVVFFLMLYLMVVCIGTSIGIAVSTSLLLDAFGAAKLPYIFVGISFCSLLSSSLYTVIIKKLGCSKVYRIFLPIAFVSILFCNFLLRNDYQVSGISIGIIIQYMAFFIFLGIDIINFNNYSSKFLNPIQKKILYSFILSATKLGGIIGGISLTYLLKIYEQNNVLLLWPISYLLALGVLILFESKPFDSMNTSSIPTKRLRKSNFLKDLFSGIKQVKSNHFYSLFAILIALDVCCGALIIYQFNEGLGQVFSGRSQDLSAFLGSFCAIANIVALVLQMFIAPRLSQTFGVTKINFVFPALSLILLIVSLYSWKLVIITLLMFHKDYIMSVFHFPNRAQFYNGVEAQKRGFFLGFFEGIWTHTVSMIFGILLIFVVQFLPSYFPILKNGFAYYFSVVGVLLFFIYLFVAYKLVSAYKNQLLFLMTADDVQSKLKACKLSFSDLESMFDLENHDQGIYDFMSACDDRYFKDIIQSSNHLGFWKILNLYPQKFERIITSFNDDEKFAILASYCKKSKEYGFDKLLDDQVILSHIETLNIKRSAKYFDALFVYIALFNQHSLLLKLEKDYFSWKEIQQMTFLNLIHYKKMKLSDSSAMKILTKVYKESIHAQQIIFKALSHSDQTDILQNLLVYFESSSQSIRKSVLGFAKTLTEKLEDSSVILEYYFEKKWGPNARICWFDLFSSLDASIHKIAKVELLKTEKKELLELLTRLVILQKTLSPGSILLEVIEQDVYWHLKFLLLFFEDDFDENCIRIVEKSLLDNKSRHKYEAIELLTSTENKEICSILMPFLESSSLLEAHEIFFPDKMEETNVSNILSDLMDEDCAWVRALSIYEITKLDLKELKDKILSYKDCSSDLYSGEMVQYCVDSWSLQDE